MQRPRQGQVIIGVDTHKEIHVAAAVDWQGTLVGEGAFPTTRQGYRLLESWARSLGEVLRVGGRMLGIIRQRSDQASPEETASPCWR